MQQAIKHSCLCFCLAAGPAGNACAQRAPGASYLNAANHLNLAIGREVIP